MNGARVRHNPIGAALSLLLMIGLLAGCTEAEKARLKAQNDKVRREQAERVLKDRVRDYWTAVRWSDWKAASGFLEEPERQLGFLREHTDGPEQHRPSIDDVTISYVFVDPETFESGEVRLAWTQYQPPANRALDMVAPQEWYRANGIWWVAPDGVIDTSSEGVAPADGEQQEDSR